MLLTRACYLPAALVALRQRNATKLVYIKLTLRGDIKTMGLYTEGSISLFAIGYLRLSFDVYYKSLEANQACVTLQNPFLVLPRIPVLCSLYRLYDTPLLTPALLRGNPSVYGELLAWYRLGGVRRGGLIPLEIDR